EEESKYISFEVTPGDGTMTGVPVRSPWYGPIDHAEYVPPGNFRFVNQNVTATGTGSGENWTNAMPQLADALKWARQQWEAGEADWDESEPLKILVAKGVYSPLYHADDELYGMDGGRDNAFVLVPYVQLYGGFAGNEIMDDDVHALLAARDFVT